MRFDLTHKDGTRPEVQAMAFDATVGRYLAVAVDRRIVVFDCDARARCEEYDLAPDVPKPWMRSAPLPLRPTVIRFTPDGRLLLAVVRAVEHRTREICVLHAFDRASGRLRYSIRRDTTRSEIVDAVVSPDARTLAVVRLERKDCELYDAATGELLVQLGDVLTGDSDFNTPRFAAFDPTGERLAIVGTSTVEVLNLSDRPVQTEDTHHLGPVGSPVHDVAPLHVRFSRDGRRLVVAAESPLPGATLSSNVFDDKLGSQILKSSGPASGELFWALAIDPDAQRVICAPIARSDAYDATLARAVCSVEGLYSQDLASAPRRSRRRDGTPIPIRAIGAGPGVARDRPAPRAVTVMAESCNRVARGFAGQVQVTTLGRAKPDRDLERVRPPVVVRG